MPKIINKPKSLLLLTSFVWVWSVYRSTLGLRGVDEENLFVHRTYEWIIYSALSLVCFALFFWLARGIPRQYVAIVGGGVCAVTLLLHVMSPIGLSTDFYRYLWQGRVSNAGRSNYDLRPWDAGVEKANDELFGRMDWKDVKSVYPPLAEQYFRPITAIFDSSVLRRTSFRTRLSLAKLPNLILFVVCGVLLYKLTNRRLVGLVWLTLPFLQFELVNSAHVDVLSIASILGALYALKSKRVAAHVLAGALVAVAGMSKLTPFVLIIPVAAYLVVNYSIMRALATVSGFLAVIVLSGRPYVVDNFALMKRTVFWFSGDEIRGGNPLHELFIHIFGYNAIKPMKFIALGAGLVVLISIIRSIMSRRLTYVTALKYSLILLLIPLIVAPIILPWYWITPLAIIFALTASASRGFNRAQVPLLLLGTILLFIQYVDRAVETSVKKRLYITTIAGLVFYAVILLYLRHLYVGGVRQNQKVAGSEQ